MSSEQVTRDATESQELQKVQVEGTLQQSESSAENSSTPPSSPPAAAFHNKMEAHDGKMGPPPVPKEPRATRKRSLDEANSPPDSVESSQTVVNDVAPLDSRDKHYDENIDTSATMTVESQTQGYDSNPNFLKQPSQKAPPSGQGAQKTKTKSGKASKGAASKPAPRDTAEEESSDDSEKSFASSDSVLPEVAIDEFDWLDLEERYHKKMQELGAKEDDIFREFEHLANYFSVWASVGSQKEVNRSYKRLKTQMTYVAHEEDELENKRKHYIRVVEAFKSALQLLGR